MRLVWSFNCAFIESIDHPTTQRHPFIHPFISQAPWNKDKGSGDDASASGGSVEPPRPPATKEDVAHMSLGMRCECQPGVWHDCVCVILFFFLFFFKYRFDPLLTNSPSPSPIDQSIYTYTYPQAGGAGR